MVGDIFPLLENELRIELGHAEVSLEARPADASIAKLLDCESGSPIMWVQRLTHDRSGNPVDFEYLAFRGDTYKYQFQIERS
jgi:GntR family transcriptional regulator